MKARHVLTGFALCAATLFTACGDGAATSADVVDTTEATTQETPVADEAATPAENAVTTYVVNRQMSKVKWTGYKVGGEHSGLLGMNFAEILMDGEKITGGVLEFNMQDIVCTDLDGEDAADLEGHLKNEDFFDSETYPTARFTFEKIKDRGNYIEGGRVWQIGGVLELKGREDIVGATAVLTHEGDNIRIVGEAGFNRVIYDITYKSKTVLGATADKFIHDDISLDFNLLATPAQVTE